MDTIKLDESILQFSKAVKEMVKKLKDLVEDLKELCDITKQCNKPEIFMDRYIFSYKQPILDKRVRMCKVRNVC